MVIIIIIIMISIIKVIELHQNCLLLDVVSSPACEFLRDTQSISFIVLSSLP